jgi:hypothetical protein
MRRAPAVLALLLLLPLLPGLQALPSASAVGHLTPVAHIQFGNGDDLALRTHYAYVAGLSGGARIIDIANPEAPVLVSTVPCIGRDIGVLGYGGRTIMVISSQEPDGCPGASGAGGLRVVDVTNPAAPVVGRQVALVHGSHTDAPVGDTGYVYIGAYNLFNPLEYHRLEVVDVRDFNNPVLAQTWSFPATVVSGGCHDILPDLARNRAYCAGIQASMIWDITDPLNPLILSQIVNPAISIHHSAAIARDGNLLILGDEFVGAIPPGGCVTNGLAPIGSMWFYDIGIPAAPVPLGFFAPPAAANRLALCTVHNFNVVEGTNVVVGAAYQSGSFMVDISNPTLPVLLDHDQLPNADTWSTFAYGDYAYAGDLGRGFDVFRLDP